MASARTVDGLVAAVTELSRGALSARVSGATAIPLLRTASLESAGPGDLSFLSNPRYRQQALRSAAGALVLAPSHAGELFPGGRTAGALIVCDAPYAWFAYAAQVLAPAEPSIPAISASADVDAAATVDPTARVDAFAVVQDGARIGPGAWIGAGCFVGRNAQVGGGTRLHPGVRVYAGCRIGQRGIVHSGAVIGADGFGFAPLGGAWVKIPQTGIVSVGDDVEIGANTTIDRGSAGDTCLLYTSDAADE